MGTRGISLRICSCSLVPRNTSHAFNIVTCNIKKNTRRPVYYYTGVYNHVHYRHKAILRQTQTHMYKQFYFYYTYTHIQVYVFPWWKGYSTAKHQAWASKLPSFLPDLVQCHWKYLSLLTLSSQSSSAMNFRAVTRLEWAKERRQWRRERRREGGRGRGREREREGGRERERERENTEIVWQWNV